MKNRNNVVAWILVVVCGLLLAALVIVVAALLLRVDPMNLSYIALGFAILSFVLAAIPSRPDETADEEAPVIGRLYLAKRTWTTWVGIGLGLAGVVIALVPLAPSHFPFLRSW